MHKILWLAMALIFGVNFNVLAPGGMLMAHAQDIFGVKDFDRFFCIGNKILIC